MLHRHAPARRWLPLVGAAVLLALAPRLATAQPVVDGTITESLYVSAGTALNTNAGFGPDITVREILYYADPIGERLYVALRGKMNVLSGDGLGLLLGFSELDGRDAGAAIGGTIPNSGHFFGGPAFAADFDVRYGFALNPGASDNTVYFDAVSVTDASAAAHYIGSTDQAGTPAAGPSSATDNSGNPGFFSVNAVAFAFNNAGTADTGLEFSIPFADLGITGEQMSAFAPSTFQAFAFVVSSSGYFSDVTVPGNVTAGNLGFGPDFNANVTGPDCSCSGNSAPIGTGPYHTAVQPLGPAAAAYSVSAPAAGAVLAAGAKVVVRWSGDDVPDRRAAVDIYLRDLDGALTLLADDVRNSGKRKVTLPAGLDTGSGYALLVVRSGDPAVFGVSDAVGIYVPADQYTFSEPDAGEFWGRGTTHTVLWAAPPGAPSGATVTLRLVRDNGTVVFTAAGEPDDGSFEYAIPANLATGSGLRFTVTSDADAAFFGRSEAFSITRIEVMSPAEGATWAVGSSQTVTWKTGAANAAGLVRLSLRSVDGMYSRALAIGVPYPDGSRTVTVPASGSVPPAGDYFVQLLYAYTPPGGTETRYVSNSNVFTVTSAAAAPPVAQRHFASSPPVAGASETLLVVRGLADGAEVGVFVTVGETAYLLAAGVVEGGDALIAVPSETVADGDDWYFGETAALTLRVFDGGTESAVEARSVTLGSDGSALESVRLASGDVVVVDASKGGAAGESASAVFAVAGVSPNPSSSSATVRFQSPSSQSATVVVYDLLGRAVQTAFSGMAQEGLNEVSLSLQSLTPGVYVVRVTAGAESAATRVTVVR